MIPREQKEQKTIITARNPAKLNICEGLPKDNSEIKTISPAEFVQYARRKGNPIEIWTEDVTLASDIKIEEFKEVTEWSSNKKNILDDQNLIKLQQQFFENLDALSLGYMGPELGFGVFAIKPFEKNVPIGMYVGHMHSNSLAFSSDYCLSLGENKENNHLLIDPN